MAQKTDKEQLKYLRKYMDTNPTETFLLHNDNRRSWSGEDNHPLLKFVKTKRECNEMKVDEFCYKTEV